MEPEAVAALTVRPYNTVTLRCVASVPDDVLLQKSFEWREGDDVLTDNGDTIVISRRNANMPESVSELTVNNPSIGSHTYFCITRITIPPLARGLIIDGNASGYVIVRGMVFSLMRIKQQYFKRRLTFIGQSPPLEASELQVVNVTAYTASVEWKIPYLSFTPEQYVVMYSGESSSLDLVRPILRSGTDLSVSNVTYSTSLQDLSPHREYFYQLRSANTYGETTSAIMAFTTLEAGQL